MRDYIAWYLIELRRRLRSVQAQSRVEDFLLETRAHIGEAVDEMTARGIAEEDATKAAITDFGHPSLVAAAFRGRRQLPAWTYWATMVCVTLVLAPMALAVVVAVGDVFIGAQRQTIEFGWLLITGFVAVVVTSLVWRRWSAVPVTLGLTLVVLGYGLVLEGRVEIYKSPTTDVMLLMDSDAASRQRELRSEWLREYDRSIAPIGQAFEQQGDSRGKLLAAAIVGYDGAFVLPTGGTYPYGHEFSPLSRDYNWEVMREWIYLDRTTGGMHLSSTNQKEEALNAWADRGERFLLHAEGVRDRVRAEREAFSMPVAATRGAVWQRLVGVPLLIIGAFGMIGVLANAVVLWSMAGWSALKRWEWRRQLS